jgi:hypothetical protein
MQLVAIKAVVAAAWVSALGAAGLAADVKSLSGWTVLVGVGLMPSLVLLWWWNDAHQTMSEAIQEALR